MNVVEKKYRKTPVYFRVFAELARAAEYRGLTTYQDLAVIMGLPTTGQLMGAETGQILNEIAEDEVDAGRPMLAALAVGVGGRPGGGFYRTAQSLGRFTSGTEERFWRRECEAVYEAWRRPLPRPQR